MTLDARVHIVNLDFFNASMLRPVLELYSERSSGIDARVIPALTVLEMTVWLRQGVAIDYFDGQQALEVLEGAIDQILSAYSELVEKQVISPNETWCDFIYYDGHPSLSFEQFRKRENSSYNDPELVHPIFESYMTLTARAITNRASRYFLEAVGWASPGAWEKLKRGLEYQRPGSVHTLYSGFAGTLNYLEAMQRLTPPWLIGLEIFLDLPPNMFLDAVQRRSDFQDLAQSVKSILSKRFNLSHDEVVSRYFGFCGELVEQARRAGPDWLEARQAIFRNMLTLIRYAGAGIQEEDYQRLFDQYIRDSRDRVRIYSEEPPFRATE